MGLFNVLDVVYCKGLDNGIDEVLPDTIHTVVVILKIAIPVILVIFGMLDLAKAVMANEEKDMKEAQKKLIKRIIYAVIVFFVFALVQFVFSRVDDNTTGEKSCLNCFINGTDNCSATKVK